MLDVLLTTLFTAAGIGAVWTLAATWLRHAPAVRQLRGDLADCRTSQEVRNRVTSVRVTAPRLSAVAAPVMVRTSRAGFVPALPLAA